ncbi:hypothetical protein Tco_0932845 [Tanacetum coccineum]
MADLKFADTHNLIAFLCKLIESEGFEQIVDFMNTNPIRYALMINPTIYILCIKQFWSNVKVKIVNGEVQLQALVDGKKIIITESTVRRDLQLKDAEGVDSFFSPQWKFLIHIVLQCLSPKTTAWNEFSSTMASAIICLAINQKFNFSKFSFESMVKNLDNVGKFLMYPRLVQVFLDKQLEGMSNHNRIYITPFHTKKIFGNMRRVGKGFSGRETPLFQTMVVQDQAEMGEGSANPTDPHHTPTFIQPSTSQPQKKQKPKKPKRKDTQIPQSSGPTEHITNEAVYKELDNSLVKAATTASSLEAEQDSDNIIKTRSKETPNEAGSQGTTSGGGPRCQETIGDIIAQTRFENVSKLSNDPLLARANEIASLKRRVKKLEKKDRSRTYKLKRLYKVGLSARVESCRDEKDLGDDASKQGRIDNIDTDAGITLRKVVEEVVAEIDAASSAATITDVEITLAQALVELKSAKPKADKVVIQEPELGTTTTTLVTIIPVPKPLQDKVKGIMIEEPVVEQVKPMKRLEQMRLDKELAFKIQAKEEEEERIAKEKAQQIKEDNIAWDDVQAKVEADYQLAQRLQAQEQEELTDEEKAIFSKKAEAEIAQESSSKRARNEIEQENVKKQKVDEDKETTEL